MFFKALKGLVKFSYDKLWSCQVDNMEERVLIECWVTLGKKQSNGNKTVKVMPLLLALCASHQDTTDLSECFVMIWTSSLHIACFF